MILQWIRFVAAVAIIAFCYTIMLGLLDMKVRIEAYFLGHRQWAILYPASM